MGMVTLKHFAQTCLAPDRGEDGGRRAIFVIGDSHAGMLLSGLRKRLGRHMSIRSVRASGAWCCGYCRVSSCPLKTWPKSCDLFSEVVTQVLQRIIRPQDIVIVSNFDHWWQ